MSMDASDLGLRMMAYTHYMNQVHSEHVDDEDFDMESIAQQAWWYIVGNTYYTPVQHW